MTSEAAPTRAYVWVWLPGATEPVVAGVLEASGDIIYFNYGRSYLARPDAVPLWSDAADVARLTEAERLALWGRQILNPFALEGYRSHPA